MGDTRKKLPAFSIEIHAFGAALLSKISLCNANVFCIRAPPNFIAGVIFKPATSKAIADSQSSRSESIPLEFGTKCITSQIASSEFYENAASLYIIENTRLCVICRAAGTIAVLLECILPGNSGRNFVFLVLLVQKKTVPQLQKKIFFISQ